MAKNAAAAKASSAIATASTKSAAKAAKSSKASPEAAAKTAAAASKNARGIVAKSPAERSGQSPFTRITAQIHIHLPPAFAANPLDGVKDYLNTFVMRYIPELSGVVLSYSDIEFQESAGLIINESPFSHFYIKAVFVLFSPTVGTPLYGVVNKVSPDHIGLLVYGVFNASIPSSEIPRDEYVWDTDGMAWKVTSSVDHSDLFVAPGSVVKFDVAKLVTANQMLSISGSLSSETTRTGLVDTTDMPTPPMAALPALEDGMEDTDAMDVDDDPTRSGAVYNTFEEEAEADEAADDAATGADADVEYETAVVHGDDSDAEQEPQSATSTKAKKSKSSKKSKSETDDDASKLATKRKRESAAAVAVAPAVGVAGSEDESDAAADDKSARKKAKKSKSADAESAPATPKDKKGKKKSKA
ncbi:hypothetical protein BC831DRAFT_419087 [Entophlyctis helioformis]|nr:hypothetical protein BC831DRAFT_419087 [Entophlyctis helioformis]